MLEERVSAMRAELHELDRSSRAHTRLLAAVERRFEAEDAVAAQIAAAASERFSLEARRERLLLGLAGLLLTGLNVLVVAVWG